MPKSRDIWRRVRLPNSGSRTRQELLQPTPTEKRAHPLLSGFQMLCLWHPARSPACSSAGWLGLTPLFSAPISQECTVYCSFILSGSGCIFLKLGINPSASPLLSLHPVQQPQRQDPSWTSVFTGTAWLHCSFLFLD